MVIHRDVYREEICDGKGFLQASLWGIRIKPVGFIEAYKLLISANPVLKVEIASCFQIVFIHC